MMRVPLEANPSLYFSNLLALTCEVGAIVRANREAFEPPGHCIDGMWCENLILANSPLTIVVLA